MSAYDVWSAVLFDDAGTPTMRTADTTCTVPYFYGNAEAFGTVVGEQEFLPFSLLLEWELKWRREKKPENLMEKPT
jgi:hypothetical protein